MNYFRRIASGELGRRHAIVVVLIMLGLLTGTGAAVAAIVAPTDPADVPATSTLTSPTAQDVASFSVFGQAAQTADSLPPLESSLLSTQYGFVGPDLADSRQITESNGKTGYLVPTNDGICATDAIDTLCSTSTSTIAGTNDTIVCSPYIPANHTQVDFLMPDGVSNITVNLSDGSQQTLPSGFNFYVTEVSQANGLSPTSISWQQNGQTQTATLPAQPPTPAGSCVNSNGASAPPDQNTPLPSGTSTGTLTTESTPAWITNP